MEQESTVKTSGLNLRQAKPVRLFEQAVEQIKGLILDGHLKPGDKLPSENELSQLLSVSRSSVREALRALESNGLIQVKSGAGAFISEDALVLNSINHAIERLIVRRNLVLQLLQVREAIECLAAFKAAERITHNELKKLEEIVRKQETLVINGEKPGHLEKMTRLDAEFHILISNSCGNDIVSELISALIPAFEEDNKAVFFVEKGYKLVEEHKKILDALKNHDSKNAEQYIREHIERVMSEIQDLERQESQS